MSRPSILPEVWEFGRLVGSHVAQRRQARGWSGPDLAARAGVSIDAIRSIETGRVGSPGLFLITRLSVTLDFSLDDLIRSAMASAVGAGAALDNPTTDAADPARASDPSPTQSPDPEEGNL